jgi:hypothetical protein
MSGFQGGDVSCAAMGGAGLRCAATCRRSRTSHAWQRTRVESSQPLVRIRGGAEVLLERVADVPGRAVVERREVVVVGTTAAGARQTARMAAGDVVRWKM